MPLRSGKGGEDGRVGSALAPVGVLQDQLDLVLDLIGCQERFGAGVEVGAVEREVEHATLSARMETI